MAAGHVIDDPDQVALQLKRAGMSVAQAARQFDLPVSTLRKALGGRAVADGTLAKLWAGLADLKDNPLLRVVSPEAMAEQNVAGTAAMVKAAERRQVVTKGDETTGQARLREALGHYSEPHQQVLVRKAEQLEQMAAVIAKDSSFSREEVLDQLLAAQPELLDAYSELERRRLAAKAEADALAAAKRAEAQQQGAEDGRVELEKAQKNPPPAVDVTPSASKDLSDLAADNTGGSDLNAEYRAALAWMQREDKAFSDLFELLQAWKKAGSPAEPDRGSTRKMEEERVQIRHQGQALGDVRLPIIKDEHGVTWRIVSRDENGDEVLERVREEGAG